MKKFTLALSLLASLPLASFTQASVVQTINLNFESGASFTGQVTFADDFSYYSAVNGVLSGGGYTTIPMTWVWDNANYSSAGPNTYSNWFMDGSSEFDYANYITFGYFYDASGITSIFKGGNGHGPYSDVTNFDDSDYLVSSSVTAAAGVPEPTSILMLGLGLLGLGFARRAAK